MNIEIITTGSPAPDLSKSTWGLSILVNRNVLFDTFCHPKPLKTHFAACNIDVNQIKHIVISHDHWDHTGGLWDILEQNNDISVYACSKSSDKFKNKVRDTGCTLIEVTKQETIAENIFTTGEIEGVYKNQIIYEQSLVVRSHDKIALLTGCSHPGILKILTHTRSIFDSDIILLCGGLHLMDKSIQEITGISNQIAADPEIKKIAPFHCTGKKAIHYLKLRMPEKFLTVSDGNILAFNKQMSSWKFQG